MKTIQFIIIFISVSYYAQCTSGTMTDGFCKYTDENGLYEGNVKNGKKNGLGKYNYNNGMVYRGSWRDNLKDGEGNLLYSNGDFYHGEFKSDSINGYGRMDYAKGGFYYGDWRNGKKNGWGNSLYPSGGFYSGNWKDNEWFGKGEYKDDIAYYFFNWTKTGSGYGEKILSGGSLTGNIIDFKFEGKVILEILSTGNKYVKIFKNGNVVR